MSQNRKIGAPRRPKISEIMLKSPFKCQTAADQINNETFKGTISSFIQRSAAAGVESRNQSECSSKQVVATSLNKTTVSVGNNDDKMHRLTKNKRRTKKIIDLLSTKPSIDHDRTAETPKVLGDESESENKRKSKLRISSIIGTNTPTSINSSKLLLRCVFILLRETNMFKIILKLQTYHKTLNITLKDSIEK